MFFNSMIIEMYNDTFRISPIIQTLIRLKYIAGTCNLDLRATLKDILNIFDRHKKSIVVESTVRSGTTFTFLLFVYRPAWCPSPG